MPDVHLFYWTFQNPAVSYISSVLSSGLLIFAFVFSNFTFLFSPVVMVALFYLNSYVVSFQLCLIMKSFLGCRFSSDFVLGLTLFFFHYLKDVFWFTSQGVAFWTLLIFSFDVLFKNNIICNSFRKFLRFSYD